MSAENYALLQEKVKKDPPSYLQEVLQLTRLFESQLELFELKSPDESKTFAALIAFLAQASSCYPTEMATFPPKLMSFLLARKDALSPELRTSLVRACILMHNRKQVQSIEIFPLFFDLFRCKDKPLRELLFRHIIADITRLNLKSKDAKLNKILQVSFCVPIGSCVKLRESFPDVAVFIPLLPCRLLTQNFLAKMLQDPVQSAARKALDIMVSLYHKNIWSLRE